MRWIHATILCLALAATALAGALEDAIRDLGSDDWKKREAATAALSAMGDEALPSLEKAAQDKDPEVRWRAERAIQSIRARGGKPAAKPDADAKEVKTPPPPPAVETPVPRLVPDALEGARERLKGVQEELRRQRPELDELLKGFGGIDLFGGELRKALEDMERSLRDMGRPERPGRGSGLRPDFFSFRYKDGKWEIVRPERPAAAKLGVETGEVPAVLRAQLKLGESPAGVVIEAVEAGSLALAAGLREFDVVLRIDGAGVSGEDDLAALLEPGEHKVAILREGERRELAFAGPAAEAPEPKAAPAPKAEAPPAAPPAKAAPEATPAPAPAPEKGDGGLRRY
jgi:hypothetical protein